MRVCSSRRTRALPVGARSSSPFSARPGSEQSIRSSVVLPVPAAPISTESRERKSWLEGCRLLAPCALLVLALIRIRGQRLIYPRIHAPPPVEFGDVRLALLSAEHLAADDLAALDEPVQLVGWLARTGCRTCDDRREALLADVEHVLAERARRLERVLPCPLDDPVPREQCVPLGRRALQEAHDECAHPPFVGGVFDAARLRHGELLTHCLVREQAPVDRAVGDRVGRAPVALEEEVRIA